MTDLQKRGKADVRRTWLECPILVYGSSITWLAPGIFSLQAALFSLIAKENFPDIEASELSRNLLFSHSV